MTSYKEARDLRRQELIKPWKVLQELVDLTGETTATELKLEHITSILDEDSPGTWVPDDLEQKDQLDLLGIEWADIEEIFEYEIDETIEAAAMKKVLVKLESLKQRLKCSPEDD